MAAAYFAHLCFGQVVYALALKVNFALAHAPRGFEQADNGCPGQGFARPRFADHAQDLARADGKGNITKGVQNPMAGGKLDMQMVNSEQVRSEERRGGKERRGSGVRL